MSDKVTYEEQQEMGLRRRSQPYVAPAPIEQRSQVLPPIQQQQVTYDVTPSAQQIVRFESSAVDRAKGFQLTITPLAVALGVLAVIAAIALKDVPALSFTALIVFWVTFSAAWLVGWTITLLMSAEFVSLYESKRKWDLISREHTERWNHYKKQR